MAYPYIPPPTVIDEVRALLRWLAEEGRAKVTMIVDRGEWGRFTIEIDGRKAVDDWRDVGLAT